MADSLSGVGTAGSWSVVIRAFSEKDLEQGNTWLKEEETAGPHLCCIRTRKSNQKMWTLYGIDP